MKQCDLKVIQEALQQLFKQEETLRTEQTTPTGEDAYALLDGEAINTYYRAGFSDALTFLLTWKNSR